VVVARSTLDQHHQALLRAFQRLLVEDRGGDHRAARQSFHRGRAKLAVRGGLVRHPTPLCASSPPRPTQFRPLRRLARYVRVRVEIMGSRKYETVGKSQ
jgi:hypothetical protein